MSKFTVDLSNEASAAEPVLANTPVASPNRKRGLGKIALLIAIPAAFLLLIAAVGTFVYWQSLKGTPQYSLALLVEAAKEDDKPAMDTLVDVDAVVDDFVPQVTGKAVELYGRGMPATIISQLTKLALPILPSVKERARDELPKLIRDRVATFGNVPFAAMVLGAGRYLDVTVTGDSAFVKSKIPEHPLELKMKRKGDRWQIVGVKDDNLATEIANKIGQEIIDVARSGGIQKAGKIGVSTLTDLLKKADELIR